MFFRLVSLVLNIFQFKMKQLVISFFRLIKVIAVIYCTAILNTWFWLVNHAIHWSDIPNIHCRPPSAYLGNWKISWLIIAWYYFALHSCLSYYISGLVFLCFIYSQLTLFYVLFIVCSENDFKGHVTIVASYCCTDCFVRCNQVLK